MFAFWVVIAISVFMMVVPEHLLQPLSGMVAVLLCVCGRCDYSLLAGLFYLIGTGATNAMLVAVYVLHKQGQAKAFWQ